MRGRTDNVVPDRSLGKPTLTGAHVGSVVGGRGPTAVNSDTVRRFLALLAAHDQDRAIADVLIHRERGATLDDLIVDLLGLAQAEVGSRWERNEWSAADEHAATAVTDAALAALTTVYEPRSHRGLVVLACAEGEWHSLPARMAAEVLRAHGWRVTFLGPSTPPAALGALVARVKPDVVAISCSMASFLPGAGRCVAACAGVPVIVGGPAFGADDRRARRVGADGWAGGARDLPAVVERLAAQRPTTPATPQQPDDREHLLLEASRGELIGGVLRDLCDHFPGLLHPGGRGQECRDGVAFVVDCAGAAVYVDDDEVLREALAWWSRMLRARGLDPALAPATLQSLASRVEGAPGVRALLGRILKDPVGASPNHHPLGS